MALSLTLVEFTALYPLGTTEMEITEERFGDVQLDRHAVVSGIVHGDLRVPKDVSAEITGIVHGSVTVESGGVAYISGTVDGTVRVKGAALVTGIIEGDLDEASAFAVLAITGRVANRR